MTPVILDTSAYSAAGRGDLHLKKWISGDHLIFVPTIVIGELRAGFKIGSWQELNEQNLIKFIGQPNVTILNITEKTAEIFSDIFVQLRRDGKSIGLNDIWIAALAIEHKGTLLTLDKGFSFVKELDVAKF